MNKLATGVIELIGRSATGEPMTRSYFVGHPAIEGGKPHIVKEINITDDFGVFHVEVTLEEFGVIWLTQIQKIIIRDSEREEIKTQLTGE
jgi:hypothetical protein